MQALLYRLVVGGCYSCVNTDVQRHVSGKLKRAMSAHRFMSFPSDLKGKAGEARNDNKELGPASWLQLKVTLAAC